MPPIFMPCFSMTGLVFRSCFAIRTRSIWLRDLPNLQLIDASQFWPRSQGRLAVRRFAALKREAEVDFKPCKSFSAAIFVTVSFRSDSRSGMSLIVMLKRAFDG